MSMRRPIMRQTRGDGITIQLAEWPGEGPPVVCLHGLSANGRWWDVVAATLAPQYRVLAMDLRGRGWSAKPPTGYSLRQHGRDVLALLDALGLERVALMGHSLGAFIALAFAARHPERVARLILVDGGGQLSAAQTARVLAGVKPSVDRLGRVFPSFAEALAYLQQALPIRPWLPALEIPYRYDSETVAGGVRCVVQAEHIQEEIANFGREDIAAFYADIRCPVLILRATEGMFMDDDVLLPEDVVQSLLRAIPQAHCVEIPQCNHYTIVFCDSAVRTQALHDFLAADCRPE